jgi:phage terminase large subunit-like protein
MDWRNNLTLKELKDIVTFSEDIVSHLDDKAIEALTGGTEADVDQILEMIMKETHSVLTIPNKKLDISRFDSLDPLAASIEESLRKESLNYFLLSVMSNFTLSVHHLEWGNLAQIYNKLCIEAARGHGKSYFFSLGYLMWKMYRYEKDTPFKEAPARYKQSKEGMLITNEYKLANHLLSIVKEEIEENDILREKLYPDGRRDGWGAESIIAKNGAKVNAKSVGSKMRGYHPWYIICDDYLNDQVLYSTEQNSKYINHFHSVTMNMIEPGGQVIVVGTPFREDDLYANLKKSGSWKVFEYPAVYPDGRVLWPERHSLKDILDKRVTQGSTIFSREMLVRPISTESSLFPYPMLKECFDEKLAIIPNIHSSKRKYKRTVLSADFAISANIGADYSVFTVLGVTENDHYDIINMWRKSGATYDEQTGVIKKLYNDFRPDVVLVEDNGMQKIFVQMLNDMGVPATGQTTTAQSKYDLHKGIPHMAALFEQGRIHIPRGDQNSINLTDILVGELTNFTWDEDKKKVQGVGAHDDTCMSLWIGVSATKVGSFNFHFM